MRSPRSAALTLGVVVSLLVAASGASVATASPADDQQRTVEQIADQIERLGERADLLNEEYSQALADKTQLDADVLAAQDKVSAQEAELDRLNVTLGQVALHEYTSSGSSGLGPLFSSPDAFTDDLQRGQLANVALDAGAETGDELEALVDQLDADRKDLERKRERAADLAKVIDDKRSRAEEYGNQLDQTYRDAQAKYQDLLAEEQARRAAESLRKLQAEQAAAQAKAAADQAKAAADAQAKDAADSVKAAESKKPAASPAASPPAASAPVASGGRGGGAGDDESSDDDDDDGDKAVQSKAESSPPPPSSKAQLAIQAAQSQLGVAYRFAASSPGVAFDCSGLTSYAWGRAGVYLPHQSAQQYASLPHVAKTDAQPGDLIFSHSPISHVSLYIGGGMMIHAPRSGDVVKIAAVNWDGVVGVGRPG